LIIGCGDDEGSSASEDGGVQQSLDEVNASIDTINGQIDDLTGNLGDLGDQVGTIDDTLTDLKTDVEGRLENLEDPDVLGCSEFEVCVPDGFDMTSGNDSKLGAIIEVVCEHEVDCCDATELNLKFGPGVESAQDCVDLFNDVVQNGFSPDFFYSYLTPSVVWQVIGVAQALNDPRVRVEIDEEGVAECVESLDAECPEIAEPGEPVDPECVAPEGYEADPCSLDNLLNGLQDEGELCGDYVVGEGEDIPECQDGFYCSYEAYTSGEQGLCAKLPEETEWCQSDYDCDPLAGSPMATNLYCNIQNAKCEALGDVGDPCTFIDEDFAINDSYNLQPSSRSATSQDCMPNLTCDPSSNTCVALCSEGRLCQPGADPFFTCGPDLLCNVTEVPALYETWGMGTCAPAIDEGDTCTRGDECETGKCADDCDLDTGLCNCSESRAPGEDCETPGEEALCRSSWCGTDSACADTCNCDENAYDNDCDAEVTEGAPVRKACDAGHYCDFGTYPPNAIDEQGYSLNGCEPLIANGIACDGSTNLHASCASGFCDTMTGLCAAKVAVDAACPSLLDEQCRTNQYCNANGICRTYLAAGANCDLADATILECAAGLVCVNAATDTCQARAESGEPCNPSREGEPLCNDIDDPTLGCIDIDGVASGTTYECYSSEGGYADNVDCPYLLVNADSYCASGWCKPNAVMNPTAGSCTQPLEEGDDCDTLDQTQDMCGEDLYCNHPQNETAGKCAQQHGPGGSCKPYFAGQDCRFGGSCIFTKDQYLCNSSSIDYETEIFCGGG
jgi:hypothetical protein